MEHEVQGRKALWHRIIRILLRGFAAIIVLLVVLIIAINIPAVQTFIAGKFIKSVREKTGTEVSLGSLKIALPNTVNINELFLLDKNADTMLYLHSLSVDVSLFGLLKNEVAVKSLTLENVVANIHRKESSGTFNFQFLVDLFAPDTTVKSDTAARPRKPWLIKVNDINLHHIRSTFSDARGGTDISVNLGDFIATLKDIDLGKKKFNINEILLKNTSVKVILSTNLGNNEIQKATAVSTGTISNTSNTAVVKSIFPDLNISADMLTFENTNLSFDNTSAIRIQEGIDYEHLKLSKLNTRIRNMSIDSAAYRAEIISMSFEESCGLSLKKLTANVQLDDRQTHLTNLEIETSASKISGDVSLSYTSFNDFLIDLWNSEITLSLDSTSVNANEIYLFAPFLASDSYIGKFKNSDIYISAKASGKLNNLNIESLELSLLEKTILKSKCRLTGLPDVKALVFDATIDRFSTTLNDIQKLVDPSVFAGLKLPPSFELKGNARGKISSVKGNVDLRTSYGNITAGAFYQGYSTSRRDTFSMDFTAQNLLAGTILADTSLGKTSFSGKASGSGITSKKISGSAHLDIHDAKYNGYTYKDIILDGVMSGNIISARASSGDTNFSFKLFADADLREAKQKYSAQLDLVRANLQTLNFTTKELAVTTSLTAEANFAGFQDADAHIALTNTTLSSAGKTLPVKFLEIKAGSAPDSSRFEITSDLLDGIAYGNIPPEKLGKTLKSAYKKYFGLSDTSLTVPGQHLDFSMNVHIPEEILKLFSPESGSLNTNQVEGKYTSDGNRLSVELKLPEAMYSGIKLDSLNLKIKGENENLAMDISLLKLAYDTLKIENLRIKEQVNKGIIHSEISTLDSVGKPSYLFANKIETGTGFYRLSFLPDGLILDDVPWKVEEGNMLEKQNNRLVTKQFLFSSGDQSIGFIANDENQKIVFGNFAIQNLINILKFKGEKRLVSGKLDGEVVFPVAGAQKFINADIAVNDLYFQDSLIGNILLKMKTENDRMDVDTRFENKQNKITVTGDVDHLSGTPLLNLKALIDINNLGLFERFSFGYLSEMKGKINGEISVGGTTKKPELKGFIGFEETAFRVSSLNFLAKIKDEKILLDQKGIHFADFVIEDVQEKKLTIDGDILTTNFSDPGFDLRLVTKDFQPINSTVADNPLFYGKLSLDADVKLKGDMKNPVIVADVKINNSTDLTYALPGSELQLVTSEGVVEFLDPSRIYDSVLALQGDYLTDSIISKLTGLDLSLDLEIAPEAKFTVDIDPKSGDFLNISGSAKLNIASDANGKQSITGIYEVKKGVYELSFYGLVKKTFTIAPGSTISWSGRPMDADLDITAEYEVRTSSVSLVANETAEMSDAEKQTFNKRLPYRVKLNINGFLAEPEISFNIDLPEKYMLTYPLVATKLALLNSEENKADLNKQVFALLVTGSFMADNPLSSNSSSPTNIASTAARNSVNGILADQLNNVSGKYISGVDVNFGLTSYEDYEGGSGDIRTEMDIQLSKKLFNDKITVEAMGSFDLEGKKNNAAGTSSKTMTNEFAVIYQLSENGEYKLRAYYEDAYDLFDGDITYSGIALIFEREFDTLKRKKKVNNEK